MTSSQGSTEAEMALAEKLIDYLSKEIETHTTTTSEFRARAHFSVLIGPFAVLGVLLVSANNMVRPSDPWNWTMNVGLVGLGLCYVVMGIVSYYMEKGARQQTDRWRELIAEISAKGGQPLTRENLMATSLSQEQLKATRPSALPAERKTWRRRLIGPSLGHGYFYAWAVMFSACIFTLMIVWQLIPPAEAPKTPSPVYVLPAPAPVK